MQRQAAARCVYSALGGLWAARKLPSPSVAALSSAAAACDEPIPFTPASIEELTRWLEQHGIDTRLYGRGVAKSVRELYAEVLARECSLSLQPPGSVPWATPGPGPGPAPGSASSPAPLRTIRVLSLLVVGRGGKILFEDEQVLPDGRSRRRGVPVSEKMVGDEPWHAALHRAVQEELGSALPEGYKVHVDEGSLLERTEVKPAPSYPGLLTKYLDHRVRAAIPGLPEGPFETAERRPGGLLRTRWAWRRAEQGGGGG